ncbi:MAG TPA: tyrosine-type recombinase/integrase [Roseiflexaceae bacterium]|nr:tyrosine-type recombinase/integrase [Roseiflexaceae bacterium]
MSTPAEQEVINLSKEKWRWMSERNVDALASLVHEKAVFVHSRSMNVATVIEMVAPSGKSKPSFAVVRPRVGMPNRRVCARPQKASTTASPVRAKKPARLPTVMTREEVSQVIGCMSGVPQLMAKLLYGSGLRLLECARLRVKDLDFAPHQVIVRDGKGLKDRRTMLPERLVAPLQEHLVRVRCLHEEDLDLSSSSKRSALNVSAFA